MGRFVTQYVCQQCGVSQSKWAGQCPSCKAWNTLVEEVRETRNKKQETRKSIHRSSVVRIGELGQKKTQGERLTTGMHEFDRVLGGGIVPGSVVLVAGEPGIGKSTLLTQVALQVGARSPRPDKGGGTPPLHSVLYICGEESPDQVAMRVRRLGRDSNLGLLPETDADVIAETARIEQPVLMIVDSVQTLSTQDLAGMAGSVGQVRESALRLIRLAKETGISLFLVGHVTKEGNVAGPKVLEHMVDVVVELTGERVGRFRILRTLKNRFGATDEVGVFAMEEAGLVEVQNPSGAFLEESQAGMPGSAIVVLMEGTRPVLVEVQALAVKSFLPIPRRVAQGVPLSKVQLLAAVLEKHCRLPLSGYDLFVSVAGGIKITEPGADLSIAMALASSVKNKALPKKAVVIGEVGLLGEIRQVREQERRIKEAARLGYADCLSPKTARRLPQAVTQWLG